MAWFRSFVGGVVIPIGYIRGATNDQNTDLQRNVLNCARYKLIFEDKISGTDGEKVQLDEWKKYLRLGNRVDTSNAGWPEQPV
ncbi:tail fiber assembly protein [Salmonella enterica]